MPAACVKLEFGATTSCTSVYSPSRQRNAYSGPLPLDLEPTTSPRALLRPPGESRSGAQRVRVEEPAGEHDKASLAQITQAL